MPAPIKKATIRAAELIDKPHPKHPERKWTVAEAAKKCRVHRSTVYSYLKRTATSPRAAGAQP